MHYLETDISKFNVYTSSNTWQILLLITGCRQNQIAKIWYSQLYLSISFITITQQH